MADMDRRPLLEKIEEIKARHLGESSKSQERGAEIMYKKQALSQALKRLDKKRQENMREYRQMQKRQQAAFMAMTQVGKQQEQRGASLMGQQPQGPSQAQQSASPQGPQGGGLMQAQMQGQQQGPQGPSNPLLSLNR